MSPVDESTVRRMGWTCQGDLWYPPRGGTDERGQPIGYPLARVLLFAQAEQERHARRVEDAFRAAGEALLSALACRYPVDDLCAAVKALERARRVAGAP